MAVLTADSTLYFLLADHLGSTVGAMDANGGVVATQAYWPYGAVRAGGVAQTDKRFTGQRIEPGDPAALGLYDYRARFYSTMLGRFVSADSVPPAGGEPALLDRFGYVTGNPLRYTDPSGQVLTDTGGGGGCDLACALIEIAKVNTGLELLGVVDVGAFWREAAAEKDPAAWAAAQIRDIRGNAHALPIADDILATVASFGADAAVAKVFETIGADLGAELATSSGARAAVDVGESILGEPTDVAVIKASTALAREFGLSDMLRVNTERTGGISGAESLFVELTGRARAAATDIERMGGGVSVIIRESRSGPVTVEIVDAAHATVVEVRFVP